MTKPPRKSAARYVVGAVALLLAFFGYYLWTYDYGLKAPSAGPDTLPDVMPILRVEVQPDVVVAEFSLLNATHAIIPLKDSGQLAPLYHVSVYYRAPQSETMEALRSSINFDLILPVERRFDPERDAVVDIVPGSMLTKRVTLSGLFDLHRPGAYEMNMSYRPGSKGGPVPRGAYTPGTIRAVATFEIPEKKPEEKPEETPPAPEPKK